MATALKPVCGTNLLQPSLAIQTAWVVALLLVFAYSITAQPSQLKLFSHTVQIPEVGDVNGYMLTKGTNRFFFIPPPKWHLQPDLENNRVICRTQDLGASVILSLNMPSPFLEEGDLGEQARARVLKKFSQSVIDYEFASHTVSGAGVTFDLSYTVQDRFKMKSRVAYIPFKDGLAEFTLTTRNSVFADFHHAFGYFLSSFRINDGPPQPIPAAP